MAYKKSGFTIVELLVVIVVIGILATITIVSYTGISSKATVASIQTELSNAKKQLSLYYVDHGVYPKEIVNNCPVDLAGITDNKYCIKYSTGTPYVYTPNNPITPTSFIITTTSNNVSYKVTDISSPTVGDSSTYGLVLSLDAGNIASYPGSGTTWTDLSGLGNNATLVGNPTYTSSNGGGIVFDGIDDYSRPTISHSYKDSSALEVVFKSNSHGTGYKTIFGYKHNSGYSGPTIGSIFLNGNSLDASLITSSQAYRSVSVLNAIQVGLFYVVCLNKDTVNGLMDININGVKRSSVAFDASTYAQWFNVGNFIGSNQLDIGKSSNYDAGQGWASDYFNGVISTLKVYNRVLSDSEITQNFNATKARYGL